MGDPSVLLESKQEKVLGPKTPWEDSNEGLCNQQGFQKVILSFQRPGTPKNALTSAWLPWISKDSGGKGALPQQEAR